MSAELAATPSNFDAHLSSVGNTPADSTGSNDSGAQEFQDSTGPSNTNAWRGDVSNGALQSDGFVNPEHKAPDEDDGNAQFDEFSGEQQASDQEQPPEQQEGDPEQQQQEGMPSYEDLQGMFQVTQAPELHQYFYDKLVPVNINGTTVQKPVGEVIQGYMRMGDYSRGKQEVTQMARQAQEALQNNRMFLQRLQDPGTFRATIKRLGPQWEQSFHKAAESYAQEKLQYLQMSPAQRAEFDAQNRAREAEARAQEIEQRLQRQEQERNNPAEAYRPHIENALSQSVPSAWQRHGISDNPLSHQLFMHNVAQLWDRRFESIGQVVEAASQATAEQLQDVARQHLGQAPQYQQQSPQQRQPVQQQMQRQQAPAQPLPPRRVPAGPPPRAANVNSGRSDQRYRGTNFDDYLKGLARR